MKRILVLIIILLLLSCCRYSNTSNDASITPYSTASSHKETVPAVKSTNTPTKDPSQTPIPTYTTTPLPDIEALWDQGIVDTWIVAMRGNVKTTRWRLQQMVMFSPNNEILTSTVNNVVTVWKVGEYEKIHVHEYTVFTGLSL